MSTRVSFLLGIFEIGNIYILLSIFFSEDGGSWLLISREKSLEQVLHTPLLTAKKKKKIKYLLYYKYSVFLHGLDVNIKLLQYFKYSLDNQREHLKQQKTK